MRIRTIKPEFFNHEGIYDAEHETGLPLRVAFIGLWSACDREGRFKWEPRRLKTQITPYDMIDFSRVLDALQSRGFIVKYENEKGVYGFVPTFDKHQVINNRERESELPNPCDCNVFDACLTRAERVLDAGKAEGKGMEGNKEGNGTRNKRVDDALALPFDSADFKLFWENWEQHRKEKKAKLTPTARNQQLEKLKDMGEHRAIAALKHSLANGWTGIFEPERAKPNGYPHKGTQETIPVRNLMDVK